MDAVLLCLVVAITDGDTLKIRCDDSPQQIVRLASIDAPEERQPFGERSRQHLAELCFQKRATIQRKGRHFDRMVASVICDGVDASEEQVRAGLAWAQTRYIKNNAIRTLEADARGGRRGLWVDAAPTPPWDWRHPPKRG